MHSPKIKDIENLQVRNYKPKQPLFEPPFGAQGDNRSSFVNCDLPTQKVELITLPQGTALEILATERGWVKPSILVRRCGTREFTCEAGACIFLP